MHRHLTKPTPLILCITTTLLIAFIALAGPPLWAENGDSNAQCLECHQDMADNLVGGKHALTKPKGGERIAVTCIGCHGDWEKHMDDPEAHKPIVSSKLPIINQADACASCHQNEHQMTMITTDPHSRSGLPCSSCHKIHDNVNAASLIDAEGNFCLTCHQTVGAQFASRSAHPLHEGNVQCNDCHPMNDRKDHQLATGFDWTCQTCHADVAGPFVYEHPVSYNHLIQGGGCVECHSAHGSPNERLLNQPGNGVCLQCHGIPPGHRTAHSGMAVKVDCVNCHTDIHGSNDNRLFLDPMLTTTFYANCYASGCHDNLKK